MKKTVIIIISIIAMISLAKCGYDEIVYGDMTPKVNPHPTKKVRIRGKFPFDENITLKLVANYQNGNPKCDTVYRTFGFVATTIPKNYDINITTFSQEGNDYNAILYKDYFVSAKCNWQLMSISALVESKNKQIIVNGGTTLVGYVDKNIPNQKITANCYQYLGYRHNNIKDQKYIECDLKKSHYFINKNINPESRHLKGSISDSYNEISLSQKDIEINFYYIKEEK